MNILLIEDNPDHAYLIRNMIDAQFTSDDHLMASITLSDGLKKLNAAAVDVCLCDLTLPDSSVEHTIVKLQECETRTPIIILSTLDDPATEQRLMHSGMQDYLPKNELSPRLLHRACLHAIERKKLNAEIEALSMRDSLTGLYNRREFDRLLDLQISTVKRHPAPLSLCLIDVDYFKHVNDELGHHAGDIALQQVSKALQSCTRDTDIPCRIGGDEFALLLSHSSAQASTVCAKKIQDYLRDNVLQIEDRLLPLALSIGIAEYQIAMGPEEFFDRADKALYQAKANGRDCIHFEH